MQINSLTLVGFRNYREQTLAFDPACNVIHGENAQGKTNLLEAIVYLSCGKSPRTRSDRELITFDGQQARITGKIFSRDREFVTDITLQAGRRRKIRRRKIFRGEFSQPPKTSCFLGANMVR